MASPIQLISHKEFLHALLDDGRIFVLRDMYTTPSTQAWKEVQPGPWMERSRIAGKERDV